MVCCILIWNKDNAACWLSLERWSSAVSNCGLFTLLQPTRHKAISEGKEKKKRKKKELFSPYWKMRGFLL